MITEPVGKGVDPLVSRGSGQMRGQGDYNARTTPIVGEITESVREGIREQRLKGEQWLRADAMPQSPPLMEITESW